MASATSARLPNRKPPTSSTSRKVALADSAMSSDRRRARNVALMP
jgi:hypothetical protein